MDNSNTTTDDATGAPTQLGPTALPVLPPEQEQFSSDHAVPLDDAFTAAALKYGRGDPTVFARVLKGMYKVESNNGRNVDHRDPQTGVPTGAAGSFGLMPAVQRKYGVKDPQDFDQAVGAAAQYLAEGYDKTGNLEDALRYYHGGPNRRMWGQFTNAYPSQVALAGEVDPQAVAHVRAAAQPPDIDAFVDSVKLPKPEITMAEPAPAPAKPKATPTVATSAVPVGTPAGGVPVRPWGFGTEVMNGMSLGEGPRITAAKDFLMGRGYNNSLEEQKRERAQYVKDNPGEALGADLLGSTPSLLLGEGLAAKGIAAGGRYLGGLLPAIEPALTTTGRVLGGVAAQGMKGVKGILARVGSRGVSGAAQGGVAGAASSPLFDTPTKDQAGMGALVGAVANPILGPLAENVGQLFSKGGGPNSPVDPTISKLYHDVEALGEEFHLRGGQIAQDAGVKALDAKQVPAAVNVDQIGQFHRALSHTFGEDTTHFTPEVLGNARKRIGGELTTIGSKSDFKLDPQGFKDFSDFYSDLRTDGNLSSSQRSEVAQVYKDMATVIAKNKGTVPGKVYGSWTSYGSDLGTLLYNKNPLLKEYGENLRNVLDQTRERVNPGIGQAWKDARTQWKNVRIAENFVGNNAAGQGDPTKLFSAAKRFYPAINSSDVGPVGTLARAGRLLRSPDDTGGVKAKGLTASVQELAHGPLGPLLGGGAAAGLFGAAESLLPIIKEHPGEALTAAGALAARQLAKTVAARRLQKALVSPDYPTRLLKGSDGQQYFINPLLPLIPHNTDTVNTKG